MAEDADETWARLCALLDDDPAVKEAVRVGLAEGGDPWEALLDALDEAGALAYLRADDTGMELADALAQLPRIHALQPQLGEVNDIDDLVEATAMADRLVAADGLRLLRLVEDDESWPIVVVPVAAAEEARMLAGGLGRRIVIGGGG